MDGGMNPGEQRRAIGRRIRQWRAERSLSQAELARRSGIAQASLSNYETGRRDLPLSIFLRVAHVLGVEIAELLHDREGLPAPATDEARLDGNGASTRVEASSEREGRERDAGDRHEDQRTRVA